MKKIAKKERDYIWDGAAIMSTGIANYDDCTLFTNKNAKASMFVIKEQEIKDYDAQYIHNKFKLCDYVKKVLVAIKAQFKGNDEFFDGAFEFFDAAVSKDSTAKDLHDAIYETKKQINKLELENAKELNLI